MSTACPFAESSPSLANNTAVVLLTCGSRLLIAFIVYALATRRRCCP